MFETRNLRSDDGVRVVSGIRQFSHGNAEQPVEAGWLEMNGEIVDTSADRQARPSVSLRPHHSDTRRGVTAIRPSAMDAVTVSKGERQELLRPSRQRDNERDGIDPPSSHAVRPDVGPQHHDWMAPFSSEAFLQPLPAVYRVLDLHRKFSEPRKAGNFVEPLKGKIRFLVIHRQSGNYELSSHYGVTGSIR